MKKIKRLFGLCFLLGSQLMLLQCSSDEPAPAKTEVYLGGMLKNSEGEWVASFSKNGVIDTLTTAGAGIYSITKAGKDVYMAGYDNTNALYWKNGDSHTIPVSEYNTWEGATNIVVKDNDIHIAGGGYGGVDGDLVMYWKNGVPTSWGNGWTSWAGNGLIVAENGDVYIGGGKYNNLGVAVTGYWKNGEWNLVSNLSEPSIGTAIALDGDDVYLACYYVEQSWKPGYWKNGELVKLGTKPGYAYDVKVVNGDVYVAGSVNEDDVSYAVYWKNGVEVKLVVDSPQAYAYNIRIKGSDVYVSGEGYDVVTCEDYKPLLWKNGELVTPFDGNTACNSIDFYALTVK